MGIAERKISYIPKEENMIGYSGENIKQIPTTKEKCGYREAESNANTHNKRKVWV